MIKLAFKEEKVVRQGRESISNKISSLIRPTQLNLLTVSDFSLCTITYVILSLMLGWRRMDLYEKFYNRYFLLKFYHKH